MATLETKQQIILGGERVDRREVVMWPAGHPAPQTVVYEVWDTFNRLVYVGVADNFERRWSQHRSSSWWLGEIEVQNVVVQGYRSRSEARQVEASVINDQAAVYNTNLETGMYKMWMGLWEDPYRPTDDWDCVPVTTIYYRWVR